MTNVELANSLRLLADVYEQNENLKQLKTLLNHQLWTKETLIAFIHAVGGKWSKDDPGREASEYALVKYSSERIPGLILSIYKDKICTKTVNVTWDCGPLLKPEEEKEIIDAINS